MIARITLEMALRKEFDYLIPAEFADRVQVGSRVKVPFGPRQVLGVVTGMIEESTHANLRPILKVIGAQSQVTLEVLQLARWIAAYYCCPVEIALKSVLPEAVRKEKEGWRERLLVRALPVTGERPKLTKRQAEVWNIIDEWRELPLQELLRLADTTAETARRLEDKGLVTISPAVSERDPYARERFLPTQALGLNAEQAAALAAITARMEQLHAHRGKRSAEWLAGKMASEGNHSPVRLPPATFLLHGVTGSGKTEVYLQGITHALERGQGAIVLVPEISLTPQTVERFKSRFGSGRLQTLVAVLHSHLSAGERHDEWHKIRQGRARIVIGARSAIFAPVDQLGLIIVDEEHEHSYKQEEAPRYHARDVAVVRGRQKNAGRAGRGHAEGEPQTERDADFFRAAQGGYCAATGKTGAGDFIFEPPRLFHRFAMSAVRLRGAVPQLQRLAHLPPRGPKALLPYLRPGNAGAARLPRSQLRQSGHPLFRSWHGTSRGNPRQTVRARPHPADGYRRAQAQGGLPSHSGRFPPRQDRYSGRHTNDRQGTALSERHAGGDHLRGFEFAPAGFPGGRTHVPVADASGGARRSRRGGGRSDRAGLHAVPSGDSVRPAPRFRRVLRAGNSISQATEISADQPHRVADVERPQ